MFESHHVSRHFEKRCGQSRKKQGQGRNSPQVNRRRARLAKRLPKLSLGVHAATHLILAAQATTGLGSDHAHFLAGGLAKSRVPCPVVLHWAWSHRGDGIFSQDNAIQFAKQNVALASHAPAEYNAPAPHSGT
jgi:hypothetical protein